MVVKTDFSAEDFETILAQYDLGTYSQSEGLSKGTVQTNYVLQTTQGKFVLRYYENRPKASVLFETDLLTYLTERHYPCPAPFKNRQGEIVGVYHHKPFVIFAFMAGHHIERPNDRHREQLIQRVAELQKLTQDFHSLYTPYRWNYGPELCRTLAQEEAHKLNTPDAHQKVAWVEQTLSTLYLPESLPKGICHADFDLSNLLFQGDELVALLDFDDANYTYLPFDLVGLMEAWAWPHTAGCLDLAEARSVVQAYMRHRPLSPIEQECLLDVYKLSILFDCIWFFNRGPASDFYEKRKIDALTNLSREAFMEALF